MVYSCVYFVRGRVVEEEEMKKVVNFQIGDDLFNSVFHRRVKKNKWLERPLDELYPLKPGERVVGFPCCSPLSGKKWIVGEIVDTWQRCPASEYCPECLTRARPGFFVVCDRCLGLMENGVILDVERMLQTITQNEQGLYCVPDDCLSCT